MIVKYISIDNIDRVEKSVIGLGNFDGVHLGHQHLIKNVIELAHKKNIKSSILSFSDPLDKVLEFDTFCGEITPLKSKLKIFEELGIDIVYVLKFDKEVSKLSPDEFIDKVLNKLNLDTIVVGDDYRFGRFGKGNVSKLSEHFNLNIVNYVLSENGIKISSTTLIEMIKKGRVDKVSNYLNRFYFIEGEVIKGLGNGHKLGFPTANINYDGFVLPKIGVYKVYVYIDNIKYEGVCNVGTHPSIDEVEKPTLEAYIFDFNQNIYGKVVKIEFIRFLRDEIKFQSINNLKNRINLDTFSNF